MKIAATMSSRKNDLEATAFHEAGHAVAGYLLRRRFKYVTIEPEETTLGHVRYYKWRRDQNPEFSWTPALRLRCEEAILTALAGPQAEKIKTGRWNRVGAQSDYGNATDFALTVCGGSEASATAYMKWLEIRCREILENPRNWRGVTTLADELLKRPRLDNQEARSVIEVGIYGQILPAFGVRSPRSHRS